MGVYDEEAHRELITIKDIRNEFAHKISVEDFESQSVSDKVKNLRIPEKYIGKTLGDLVEQPHLKTVLYKQPPENVRERFLIATQIYIILLSHAADKSQGAAPHTPRF